MASLVDDLRNLKPTLPFCQFEFFSFNEFDQLTHADPLTQLLLEKGLNLSGKRNADPYDIVLSGIAEHYSGPDQGFAMDFYLAWDMQRPPLVQSSIEMCLRSLGA